MNTKNRNAYAGASQMAIVLNLGKRGDIDGRRLSRPGSDAVACLFVCPGFVCAVDIGAQGRGEAV